MRYFDDTVSDVPPTGVLVLNYSVTEQGLLVSYFNSVHFHPG